MSSTHPTPPSALAVGLALASVYLVWGSTYLAIRVGLEGYPPFLMGSLRFLAASAVFYAFLRWRGHAPPTRAQWKNAAIMGLFMMLLGNGMVNFAEQTVSSGLAAVAVASMPLWAGLFGVLRGQHPSRGEWLGLVVGFAGVVWLNFDGEMQASLVGMVALVLAPMAWAWGSVWSRGRDLPAPFMSTAAQMLCGGVAMGVLGLSLTGKALDLGIWALEVVDLRRFGQGKHLNVDDTPAGGGAGMVLRADVVDAALRVAADGTPRDRARWPVVYLSPQGQTLSDSTVATPSRALSRASASPPRLRSSKPAQMREDSTTARPSSA